MYKLITFDKEQNYIDDFLGIPKELYSRKEIVQNEKEELELLLGTHLLSKYFKLYKLLVYNGMKACARGILTIYPDDDCSYLGFFESIDVIECANLLFEEVNNLSRSNNCHQVKGPIDSSFWIKYRLKINNFDKKSYVSEPYNKAYYLDLFIAGGYQIAETYVSNYYKKPPLFGSVDKKSKERYQSFIRKGYHISSPRKRDFDSVIRIIYKLIMELYKDFPVFKGIEEEDFVQHFRNYLHLLDFSFVKLAYYNNAAVGFVIAMPDYGNLLYGKLGYIKYTKLFLNKIRCRNYVLLYMGVKPEHYGLGNAMAQTIIKNVQKKRSTAIGSLIKEGKVTQRYVDGKILSSNTYALLEYNLD